MDGGGPGVVIVGAGPAGLLLAHLLLSNPRPHLLPVRIFESRGDPCIPLPTYKTRQYSVGLSARGQNAINHVGDLWQAVQEKGVLTSQFVVHTGSRSIALKRNPDKPSLLINQRALAATLISELRNRYPADQFQIQFEKRCIWADFDSHTVIFDKRNGQPIQYKLLVGADGVRSTVREEFIRQRGFDYQQVNMPYTFKVLNVSRPSELSSNAVHSFRRSKQEIEGRQAWFRFLNNFDGGKGSTLRYDCLPAPGDEMSVLIGWTPSSTPEDLLTITSAVELKEFVEKYMPPLKVSLDAAQAFIEQRATSSMKVKCNRFHDINGKAVLIGDAAHAMSNALGQGCNSSLQDALVLGKMLQEREISDAIDKYTQKQVKEDHAAAYLSEYAFPQAQWLLPFFLFGNMVSSLLSKALPSSVIKPSIQSLCSETLVPYSERCMHAHCISRGIIPVSSKHSSYHDKLCLESGYDEDLVVHATADSPNA